MKYEMKCVQIIHPAVDDRFIDILMFYDADDPDPYTVGSIVEDLVNNDYIWVLKGGYTYGSASTKQQEMDDCEAVLKEFYLDKGLMPWKSAFMSSN